MGKVPMRWVLECYDYLCDRDFIGVDSNRINQRLFNKDNKGIIENDRGATKFRKHLPNISAYGGAISQKL